MIPEEELWKRRNCLGASNPAAIRPWLRVFGSEEPDPDCENMCPHAIPDEVWLLVGIWREYMDLDVLPEKGDLKDQVAWVYEVIQLCEGEKNEFEYKKMKSREREMEARTRELEANKSKGFRRS